MNDERKRAATAYKERAIPSGLYGVRCTADPRCWIGSAPDLTTIQNRIWFTLRLGTHPCSSLQTAWNAHGADSFSFEIVERLPAEEAGMILTTRLRDRLLARLAQGDAIRL